MKKILIILFFIIIVADLIKAVDEPMSLNINFNNTVSGSSGGLNISISEPQNDKQLSGAIKVFLIITVLSLAPAIFILCTSFIRIIIVLSILRQAIGLQQVPPNQVLIGFAFFLTIFNMLPVVQQINDSALKPYREKKITWEQAIDAGIMPVKKFMLSQTRDTDLSVFMSLSKQQKTSRKDLSIFVVIPAFVMSEMKTGFEIGFILYIPFLVVDMIIASILMSMGMMMLPPVMISLPFKILLFILIDGWRIVTESLLRSFH